MDPKTSHLADLVVRIAGADGSSAEVPCCRLALHNSSPIFREMLGTDMAPSLKRTADGMHILELRNDRLPATACADTLALMHDPEVMRAWDFERGLATAEVHRYLQMPMSKLLHNLAFRCDMPEHISAVMAVFDHGEICEKLEPLAERFSDLAHEAAGNGDLDAMVPAMRFLRAFSKEFAYVRSIIGDVMEDLRPAQVLDWVASKCEAASEGAAGEGGKTTIRDACDMATMRVPPILVACKLAELGRLDADMYDHVISRNIINTTPACFEVLRQVAPDIPEHARDAHAMMAWSARSSPKAVYHLTRDSTVFLLNRLHPGKPWTSHGGCSESVVAKVSAKTGHGGSVPRVSVKGASSMDVFVIGWHETPAADEGAPATTQEAADEGAPAAPPAQDDAGSDDDAATEDAGSDADAGAETDVEGDATEAPARQGVGVLRVVGSQDDGAHEIGGEPHDVIVTTVASGGKMVGLDMSAGMNEPTARLYVLAMSKVSSNPPIPSLLGPRTVSVRSHSVRRR